MVSRSRAARKLVVAWLAAAAVPAGATGAPPGASPDVPVSFDADLARPDDRVAYERTLREMAREARERVVAGLGIAPPPATEVRVHSRAGYERVFGAGAASREAAHLVDDVIHVNGGARLDDRVAGLLVHEMAHLALDADGKASRLPRWLDEGLSEQLGLRRRGIERPDPGQVVELRQAREARRLVPLPREGDLDPLGYLRAWSAVRLLEQRAGRERVLAVVRATLGGEDFEKALRRETGLTTEALERELEAWVGRM